MTNSIFDRLVCADRLAFLSAYEATGAGGLTTAERAELAELRAIAKETVSILPELTELGNDIPQQHVLTATQFIYQEVQKIADGDDACICTTGGAALSLLLLTVLTLWLEHGLLRPSPLGVRRRVGNPHPRHGRDCHKTLRMVLDGHIQTWESLAVLIHHGRVINIGL